MKLKEKIKILHLISHMNDGGAQRIVLNYFRDLQNDFDVELKLLVYGEKNNSFCNNEIEKNNYNVDYLFKNIHNKYLRKTIKILYGKHLLTKYIREYNPDIVHVHISPFLRICLKSIIKCNVPIRFDTLHSNPYRFKGKDLMYIRKAFQSENFVGICVTNEQIKQGIDYYGLKKYEVVHNGIDIDNIRKNIISKNDARKKFNVNRECFVVGAIGRLSAVKNYPLLLKSFAELLKENKKAILLIAGDGEEKGLILNLINELKINDNVRLLGNLSNVVEFYCAIDILAITSISESSSLTLLESQVCDVKAVISSGVPSESIVTNKVKKMKPNATIYDWKNALMDKNYVGSHKYKLNDYDVHEISNKMKSVYLKYWKEYQNDKQNKEND